jgi:hypothetical protein
MTAPKAQKAPKAPPPPTGLQTSGKRLWRSVSGEYELEIYEQLLLLQACRCADRLDLLAIEASTNPVTVVNMKGDRVSHPALVESRQQSLTLSRLIASLRLPSGEEEGRPQRRGASRGSYGIRGVV